MINQKRINFIKRLYSELKASNIQIERSGTSKINYYKQPYGFGGCYTDHMFEVHWNSKEGWGTPRILPLHNLDIHPGLSAIQYSVEAFEGMKSKKGVDQKIRLFRPLKHLERLRNSSKRLILPDFEASELLDCVKKLIEVDKTWHMETEDTFLYLRPTIMSTDINLGVNISENAMLYVIMTLCDSPSPLEDHYMSFYANLNRMTTRVNGQYKLGSNYAPIIESLLVANQHNCHQCLFFSGEDRLISEAGTVNFFALLVNKNGVRELVTPPIDSGFLLPGVTRDSVLEICRKMNDLEVSERDVSLFELEEAGSEGRLLEMFCTGTASAIKRVDKIAFIDKSIVPQGEKSFIKELHSKIHNIFVGREEFLQWTVEI